MPWHRSVAPALLAGLVACGGSATDPALPNDDGTELPDLHAQLTGRFVGTFRSEIIESEDRTIALDGVLSLELTESDDGSLTGAFALQAVLHDDPLHLPIEGAGPLAGSVSSAQTAALGFTATPAFCPDRTVEFSGTFDRRVAQLRVDGPIIILDMTCMVVRTFPSSIPLGL